MNKGTDYSRALCYWSQGETTPFKPYNHRFPTPYWASNSTSPLWYSIRRGPATIIVLSSYSAYGRGLTLLIIITSYSFEAVNYSVS